MESLAFLASLVMLSVIAPSVLCVGFMIAGRNEFAAFCGGCAAFLGIVWASLTPNGFPFIAVTNLIIGWISLYRWRRA